MGEPARKLAKQKSTGAWLVVEDPGDGKWRKVDALADEPEHWTGEQYDLVRANADKDPWLKSAAEWYGANMVDEPSGPIDDNGKTTATPAPPKPANDNATPAAAPANDNAAPVSSSSTWGSLANVALDKIFGGDLFGNGERVTEPVESGLPGDARQKTRGYSDAPVYRDDGTDFMRGLGQGVTLRAGDELAGGLEGALALMQSDVPRTMGRGADAPLMTTGQRFQAATNEAIDRNREDNAESQARSPYRYGAGELVGAGSVAALTAPVAAAGAPWTAMVAPNAAQGAAMGYLAGYGGSEGDSRLSDAATGAAAGALGGAGATALGAGAQRVARVVGQDIDDTVNAVKSSPAVQGFSNYMGNLANRSRAAATGAYGSQLKQLSKNEGFDYVDDEFGQAVEDMFPPEPGILGIPKPRTARDYAELARPKQEEIGQKIGSTLRQLDDEGVSAPVMRNPLDPDERAVLDTLDEEIASASNPMHIGGDDDVMREALKGVRERTLTAVDPQVDRELGRGLPRLKPTELAEMKRSLERSGYATEATKGLPQGVQREANRIAAAGPREALRSAVKTQADPATAQRFTSLNRQFPIAKQVAELSEGRAAQEQGNQIASLPGAMATALGGPAAAPAVGAWEVAKRYGADVGANAARSLQRATQVQMGPVPAPAVPAAVRETATAQAAAAPANTWAALAHAGQTAAAQDAPPPADAGRAQQRVEIGEAVIKPRTSGEQSLGHMNTQAVRNALRAYPQALGPFKQQLEQAFQAPDPVALSTAVADLQRTSPEFRRVLEELAAQENVNRSGGNR
jgi:hypothetical protein